MKRLYEIDLLRIIAALAVVIFHYTFSGWMQGLSPLSFPGLGEVSRYGYLGVDLFFDVQIRHDLGTGRGPQEQRV